MHFNRVSMMTPLIVAGLIFIVGCGDGSSKPIKIDLDESCDASEVIGLDGSCLIGCPEGQIDVDGKCEIDESSCGADKIMVRGICAAKDGCGPGQALVDGVCTCPDGKVLSGGFCVKIKGLSIQSTNSFPLSVNVGDEYKAAFKAINGSGDYAWKATGLPDGLKLDVAADTKTVAISGRPTQPHANHAYSLTVTEADDPGKSYTKKVGISIAFASGIGVFQEPAEAGKPWIILNVGDLKAPLSLSDGQAVMLKVAAGSASYKWSCDGSEKDDASGIPCVGHAGLSLAKEPRPNRVWSLNSAEAVFCADKRAHPWCTKPVRNYEVGDNVRYLVPDDAALAVELKALSIGVAVDNGKIDTTIQSVTFIPDACAHFTPEGADLTATYRIKLHKFLRSVISYGKFEYASTPTPAIAAIKFIGNVADDPFKVHDDNKRRIGISILSVQDQLGGHTVEAQLIGEISLASKDDIGNYTANPGYNVVISDSCAPANTAGFKLTVVAK